MTGGGAGARAGAGAAAGRLAAVTGAARGIGLAASAELVRRGWRVALGDLDGDLAELEAARLAGVPGQPAAAAGFELDVTSDASFAGFLERASAWAGRPVDVLVNNAGVMWVGRHDLEPEDAARRQFEVNVHGTVRGMRLVLPEMRARRSGHVVNVTSAAARLAPAGEATYAATKHAVHGYSLAVREELRGSGVRLSVVMPVVVETELAAGTTHGRGIRLRPEQVADAIAGVLERPRFEVWVPRSIGVLSGVLGVLPQRLRDPLYGALMPDQVKDADQRARAAYEARSLT